MDNPQKVFELVKRHLDFKDNWGNNPYMPKDKADELLKEFQHLVSEIYEEGKTVGARNAIVKLIGGFQKEVRKQKDASSLNDEQWQSIRSFLDWQDKTS